MMIAAFTPKHTEKAFDMARNVSTFGQLEFTASFIRMRIMDPAKVIHVDVILVPDTYRCDKEFSFGINLQMFYKLLKSLDNNDTVELESDGDVMKISQKGRQHVLIHQDIPFGKPEILDFTGPQVVVPTKTFLRYIRAIGNIAPAFELHYSPTRNTLSMESVNSIYRTTLSLDTTASPNTEEFRGSFMVKFVAMGVNPSLADTVKVTMGDSLVISYQHEKLSVLVSVAGYTDE